MIIEIGIEPRELCANLIFLFQSLNSFVRLKFIFIAFRFGFYLIGSNFIIAIVPLLFVLYLLSG